MRVILDESHQKGRDYVSFQSILPIIQRLMLSLNRLFHFKPCVVCICGKEGGTERGRGGREGGRDGERKGREGGGDGERKGREGGRNRWMDGRVGDRR